MSGSGTDDQTHSTGDEKLKPPVPSVEDPGAHELDSSEDEDEHFSDASEGRRSPASGRRSPIPSTRVEKVGGEPSYGEVPGTTAYEMRKEDAVPDEVEIIGEPDNRGDAAERPTTPGGRPIPLTVVEKVDPSTPSHGDVPGTEAHEVRKADAVPDLVLKIPESGAESGAVSRSRSPSPTTSTPGDHPIPITKLSRVDSPPTYGGSPRSRAFSKHKEDAEPDIVEKSPDVDSRGSPTPSINRSPVQNHARRKSTGAKQTVSNPAATAGLVDGTKLEEYDENEDGDEGDGDFGDDFDDFEEGGEDEDFGDFDDGFRQGTPITGSEELQPSLPTLTPAFRILDFNELDGPDAIRAAVMEGMNSIYPYPTDDNTEATPSAPLPKGNTVFLNERSLSLWSQLVAPPPLQPPDWLRSRIRRLFLVSLGVPIDLDEILPASKQKKLILPSTHLNSNRSSPRPSSDSRAASPISRLKQKGGANLSTASFNSGNESSQQQQQRRRSPSPSSRPRKRKGPPPPPVELDILATRMLCSTTDAALANLTDEELCEHVRRLAALTESAGEVLEYWLKRKDEAVGDKEAFEGVIENLVKHARKVRK
ncbi:hypothetical protein FGG08_003833 [Glutinoglossum americanum]|uniref:Uncharacterized protein n=1 Tax=Glutinoglossum americanum TaxID=1670608 RepID=A0A9P8I6D3_9PEZI|nr:hypothetical protein FGG08_003833 [Glutinoglossum americanum]